MNHPADFSLLFSAALIFSAAFIPAGHAADNLRVIGELYNDPCTLLPENKDLVVDFSDVSLPDLYEGVEVRKSFSLILSDCDITDMNRFKIKFTETGTRICRPIWRWIRPVTQAGLPSECGQIIFR
ncbi:fimbrial protein [Morganella morganii]